MNARFDADEYAVLEAAAQQMGLMTTGYVAEVAVAAAGESETPGGPDVGGVRAAQLARVQRELLSAIRQLVLQAPAPVVAEALGIHHTTATRQAIHAGSPWNRYAPGAHNQSP